MLSRISRTIICLRISSVGCSSPLPPRLSRARTLLTGSSNWLAVVTSFSTMATTRSSSTICACRPVLISRPAHRPISFACSLKCIGFSLSVTGDAVFQERFHAATGNIAEAFEDNLQEDATVRLVVESGIQTGFIVIDPVAVDHPQFPAAAVVLEAAEGLDGAV